MSLENQVCNGSQLHYLWCYITNYYTHGDVYRNLPHKVQHIKKCSTDMLMLNKKALIKKRLNKQMHSYTID